MEKQLVFNQKKKNQKIAKIRPKMPLTAENTSFGRKYLFRPKFFLRLKLSVTAEFRYFKSHTYGFGVSVKIPFWSHTNGYQEGSGGFRSRLLARRS